MLWREEAKSGGRTEYTIMDAFAQDEAGRSSSACYRWAKQYRKKPQLKDMLFTCLPDTVDPRRPKGK